MAKEHHYTVDLIWSGNRGQGTKHYRSYSRNFLFSAIQKPSIAASADPSFLGDADKYNPEELFLVSIASCHMLWYLHLCADAGVNVLQYLDKPTARMEEGASGGAFKEVHLFPKVTVLHEGMVEKAGQLHQEAHHHCFIANSCNFPIHHHPDTSVQD